MSVSFPSDRFSRATRLPPRGGLLAFLRHQHVRALTAGVLLLLASCSRQPAAPLPPRPELVHFPAALSHSVVQAETELSGATHPVTARLALGELYQANGFSDEARQCYEPITKDAVVGAKACYFLAQLEEQRGDLAAERRWLEATLARDPSYIPAQLMLADTAYKANDITAAVAAYRAVLARDPQQPEAIVGLARERLQAGDDAKAIALLEQVTAAHPKFSTGFSLLAQAVDRRGDSRRAAELREKARAMKDPPRADPWSDELMRQCYDVQQLSIRFENFAKSGREEEATATLRQLESIAPQHWLVARLRGLAASQRGREADAASEYQHALAAGGDAATLYPALLNSLVALKRYDEAEVAAAAGLKQLPEAPALLVAVANLRVQQRRVDEAVRLIRQALSYDQQNLGANRALTRILWDADKRDEALPHLEFIRRVAANDVAVRGMLGEYYLDHDRPAAAVETLTEASALEPDNRALHEALALAHLRVANQLAREQHLAEAVAAYDRAIAARPDYVEAYANKIQVCAYAGWFDRAEQATPALLALNPRDPAVFVKLGDVARAAGKSVDALDYWNRAARLLDQHADPRLREAILSRLNQPTAAQR